jgi:hypothetical protein
MGDSFVKPQFLKRAGASATSRHLPSGRLVEMLMSTNTSSEHRISDLDFRTLD